MSSTYTVANYDSGVLPKGLHKDVETMVHGALAVGWKLRVKGMIIRLIAPSETKTITVSASNKNIPFERYKRIIQQHANPLLLADSDERATDYADALIRKERENAQRREAEESRKAQERAEREVEKEIKRQEAAQRREVEAQPKGEGVSGGNRTLVSEAPMMAHRGQRRGYLSSTTNERTWSDGSVDYACRSEGCDFASDDRSSVSRHWRSRVSKGEEQPAVMPKQHYVTPPHEPIYNMSYTPRRERVSALAAVLAALDLEKMGAEEIAEFVLNWQHEQSESGGRMAAEREEMTDSDILLRIRSLLDNGTYLNQQEQIKSLGEQVAELTEARDKAIEETKTAQDRWNTLRSLMDEE